MPGSLRPEFESPGFQTVVAIRDTRQPVKHLVVGKEIACRRVALVANPHVAP
jgi:hypothetical protein